MPAELQALDQAMRELLAMLSDPESAGIDRAWVRCQKAQAEVVELLERRDECSPDERNEIRKGLEGLVRMNAIARQATLGAQDSLAKTLLATKQANVKMQGYGAKTDVPGASCDMAG